MAMTNNISISFNRELDLEEIDRLAEVAHFGQVDKIGDPYILHPRAVAKLVLLVPSYSELTLQEQWSVVAVALLHDVIEDTPISGMDLFDIGIKREILYSVKVLTKTNGPIQEYYVQVANSPIARVVKVADMAHNADPARLSRILDIETRRRLEAKYSKGIGEITKGFPNDRAWFKARTGL